MVRRATCIQYTGTICFSGRNLGASRQIVPSIYLDRFHSFTWLSIMKATVNYGGTVVPFLCDHRFARQKRSHKIGGLSLGAWSIKGHAVFHFVGLRLTQWLPLVTTELTI